MAIRDLKPDGDTLIRNIRSRKFSTVRTHQLLEKRMVWLLEKLGQRVIMLEKGIGSPWITLTYTSER